MLREKLANDIQSAVLVKMSQQDRIPTDAFNYPAATGIGAGLGGLLGAAASARMPTSPYGVGKIPGALLGGLMGAAVGGGLGLQAGALTQAIRGNN